MQRIRALGLAFLLVACGTARKEGPPRYRAWCNTETKYLAPWRDTRAAADTDREEHLRMWGWHAVRIDMAD